MMNDQWTVKSKNQILFLLNLRIFDDGFVVKKTKRFNEQPSDLRFPFFAFCCLAKRKPSPAKIFYRFIEYSCAEEQTFCGDALIVAVDPA